MDRLSENAIRIVDELHTERLDYNCEYIPLRDALDRLAAYEDAEEQGLLVRLPCKIGDSYYRIERFCNEHGELPDMEKHWGSDCVYCNKPCNAERRIEEYRFKSIIHIINNERDIGKTVFLTREEAEAALATEGRARK